MRVSLPSLAILPLAYFVCRLLLPKNVMLDKLEGSRILDSIEMRGQKRQVEDLPARFQGMKQTIKGEKMIAANWK